MSDITRPLTRRIGDQPRLLVVESISGRDSKLKGKVYKSHACHLAQADAQPTDLDLWFGPVDAVERLQAYGR